MKSSIPVVMGVLVLQFTASANEIDFVERYALAADREQVLQQLIPGTEPYYFYSCLFHQSNARYDEVNRLLKEWQNRHGQTTLLNQIQHRQVLLTYGSNPNESLAYLKSHFDLQFNHEREQLDAKPNLPTSLDSTLISRQHLDLLARQRHKDLSGFSERALERLAQTDLDSMERRDLLSRLRHPDVPGLASLVIRDLQQKSSRGFGSLPIHQRMFTEQLDECVKLKPDLFAETEFVHNYLMRLAPNDDVDWHYDDTARENYLNRLWNFADKLAPAHNSLKANILYHRLVHDRSRGTFDKSLFLTYLQLPKAVHYVNPRYLESDRNRYIVDLNYDGIPLTRFPPILDDEKLVRDYLQHFFLTSADFTDFAPYLSDTFLKHLFAETKLVHGIGDAERWYAMLPADNLQQLRDRVDLDFATTNPLIYDADEDVHLELSVKNVRTLILKVFEINTKNYYLQHDGEPDTDIDLDGLVPNLEETFQYEDPPLRRVQRNFNLSQLKKPGVYVVDFIGNGESSRAVIRKGTHRFLVRTGPNGQVFTILNGKNEQLQDARLWMGGREYEADERGSITIPFSTQPCREKIIITQSGLSSSHFFQHESENYELQAGIYVDRETLLRYRESGVLLRTSLLLNGVPISLSVLQNPTLTITSTDLEGIESTKEVSEIPLFEDRESLQPFQVPPRLASIRFTLTATVRSLSEEKDIPLRASREYRLNEIDRSQHVADLHLLQSAGEYCLELRGKSGEELPERVVTLRLKHVDYESPVDVKLKTDPSGQIRLGRLADVKALSAATSTAPEREWQLNRDRHAYHQSVHSVEGQDIRVPGWKWSHRQNHFRTTCR